MPISKLNLLLSVLIIGSLDSVTSQCPPAFSTGNSTDLCYSDDRTALAWLDAYEHCMARSSGGILLQISSIEQWKALEESQFDPQSLLWLGANNFASFRDSEWHWLDGSVVDSSVTPWCPQNTEKTALGTQCIAYDPVSRCLTNQPCSTQLPGPCVPGRALTGQSKALLSARVSSSGSCTNAYGGAYANWWTYSMLLLNWFILFCFILYLCNRLLINKRTTIVTVFLIVVSFLMIMAFAVLWGLQYNDIMRLPIVVVVLGSVAGLILILCLLILTSNRMQVRRSRICQIAAVIILIVECALMLGLIICIVSCSGYISLVNAIVERDIIASLLASIVAAISVLFSNAILYLITSPDDGRVQSAGPHQRSGTNTRPLTTTQIALSQSARRHNGVNTISSAKRFDQIERGTSPVDARILDEFYMDRPKDMHTYELDGRQYYVYEGKTLTELDNHRKALTQAMLGQESRALREAIANAKNSVYAPTLADEIHQAENLLDKL